MGLFRKKKVTRESRRTRVFRLFLWYLFRKTRCRERIESGNRWAEHHKGSTSAMTVGTLLLLLVIGTVMPDAEKDGTKEDVFGGIAEVNPMFLGLQRIQDNKAYQMSKVEEMTLRGKRLKHELDSLVRIPRKSHDDSLQIVIKHRQLELIVNNLENR